MHLIQFDQIVRDAEVARYISPIVQKHHLSEEETSELRREALDVTRELLELGALRFRQG